MRDKNELLRNIGREAGSKLVRSAIQSAESHEQMANQIFTARWAAIHVLATEMFNIKKQTQMTSTVFLNGITQDLQHEYEWISKSTMVKHEPNLKKD